MSEPTEKIERAKQEVFRICRDRGRWQMTIPVDRERDSDCLIVDGLEAGLEAIKELARLAQERDDLQRLLEQGAAMCRELEYQRDLFQQENHRLLVKITEGTR